MNTKVYEDLEGAYLGIVELMPDKFDSHDFIMRLSQENQKLYILALYENRNKVRPFETVHKAIAKRLKKHTDLVEQEGYKSSRNIFGLENRVAKWRRVK